MIYNSVTQDIAPGKMAEWEEIFTKESMPIFTKLGMKLVGSWHGYTGNVNEMYLLFVYNDLSEFQKMREAQRKNADYQRVSAKLSAFVTRQTRTLLEPNAWSPMK